eukprot:m.203988 g.203988  ORF g.203988 m.203988 type:complete len:53 (+) comp17080_c0_seq1:1444-1602(+)
MDKDGMTRQPSTLAELRNELADNNDGAASAGLAALVPTKHACNWTAAVRDNS